MLQTDETPQQQKKRNTEKSYNYAFVLWESSLESTAWSLVSLALDLDSTSLALETISLIVRESLEQLVFIGGWTSLPLSASTETSISGEGAWMVEGCSRRGRRSAAGGRSVDRTSQMSSRKKVFPAFLNSKSAGTPARLSASAHTSVQ